MTLKNFQGIENFSLDAECKNCTIKGMNGSGKTTVASAFCYLLYDLNSTGKTFLPKPLNLAGEAKHGLTSSVQAIFVLDGEELALKKSFKENWVKKHGVAKKFFTGHTTQYYIDDMEVPARKKDYDARLERIANSTTLKLLTNKDFFAAGTQKTKRKDDPNRWDWEKRRELLFEISNNMPTDENIIKADKILSGIPDILGGKSFDQCKARIKERQKGLNKLISEIPISIKERERDLPDITDLGFSAIEKELIELLDLINKKEKEKIRIESGGEIAELTKKQREIESELLEIENRIAKEKNRVEKIQRKKIFGFESARDAELSAYERMQVVIKQKEEDNERAERKVILLREEWNATNGVVFDEKATICPTCGQQYPEEKTLEIREIFHTGKAANLLKINDDGKRLVDEIKERKEQTKINQEAANSFDEKVKALTQRLTVLVPLDTPIPENKRQEVLSTDLAELKLSIEGLKANSSELLGRAQETILALSEKHTGVMLKRQAIELHQKGLARIKELVDQQKEAASEFENLEGQAFLLNEFTKTKAMMVEEKINEKFDLAKFKLFNILVNGEVDDCCRVKYQGICFDEGLNHSGQVNLGIDIINTLSKHFDLTMPLFLDDMNLVTKTIPTKNQIIKLIVDPQYKQLTVIAEG
ncbi:MAG: hypothetical protein BA867_09640 [Desulfobacterales bacterium S5133MH16]|nr:MAG: hypothetical protein BA867_09640 [Desulfobacterales bacterium S5133MH16]